MIPALTEIPRALTTAIPPAIGSALINVNPARIPQSSTQWLSVAETVGQGWLDGGNASAAKSLHSAAKSAANLEGRAGSLDQAVLEGASAIAAALVDLGRIAMDFITSAVQSLSSSVAAGPAGFAMASTTIAASGQEALAEATMRLKQLEQELAGPISTLAQLISEPDSTPAPPVSHIAQTDSGTIPAGTASDAGSHESNATSARDSSETISRSSGAPTPQAQAAVDNALSAVGTPYQWGGNTPGQGLDCSGLTHWAYGQAGVDIPRTAAEQAVGRQVSQNELLPGDLVVWDGHVAMVVGDGQMVEAGDPVQVNPIRTSNMGMGFKGFYRPTG